MAKNGHNYYGNQSPLFNPAGCSNCQAQGAKALGAERSPPEKGPPPHQPENLRRVLESLD